MARTLAASVLAAVLGCDGTRGVSSTKSALAASQAKTFSDAAPGGVARGPRRQMVPPAARRADDHSLSQFNSARPRRPDEAEAAARAQPAPPVRSPLDQTYFGGPVAPRAVIRPIYLTDAPGCTSGDCFGDPKTFLDHLVRSDYLRVLDQYTGAARSEGDRSPYSVAAPVSVPLPPGLPIMPSGLNRVITDVDIQAVVTSVARTAGVDHGNLYQVYLPPDVDYCTDSSYQVCFAPDLPSFTLFTCVATVSFGILDEHGRAHSVTYTTVPNAGYSLPNGGDPFCRVEPGTPNGQLIDSQALLSVLGVITGLVDPGDPFASDGGPGWLTFYVIDQDPGVICLWNALGPGAEILPYLASTPLNLAGKRYAISRVYSNKVHACLTGTNDDDGPARPSGSFAAFYVHPADLYNYGGRVSERGVSRPVFLTDAACSDASCYGDPKTFLDLLGRSRFIHVVDEFMPPGARDPHEVRYTTADPILVPLPPNLPILPGGTNRMILDRQLREILAQVADAIGQYGDSSFYHVFLPPQVDLCSDSGFSCFSPDNNDRYFFAAYHDQFFGTPLKPDANIIYSALPNNLFYYGPSFQTSVLSHELFELITDPNWSTSPGWSSPFFGPGGIEIADDCEFLDPTEVPVDLAGTTYLLQSEYSNLAHGCVTAPVGEGDDN